MFLLEKAAAALLDRTVRRRLRAPPGVPVVAVGGATWGGSGKTPLAIACAAELAALGVRVALVGHAYRGRPGHARWVSPVDRLDEVGDEALLAARLLEACAARVAVAPSRAEALAWAGEAADVLVVDGVAQLAPVPAELALLSVDARHPWGPRQWIPPRSLLRAPVTRLVAACDAIVTMGEGPPAAELEALGRSVWPSHIESRGAWAEGPTLVTWATLRTLRVGLVTALARPERLLASLARRGVSPSAILRGRNHGPLPTGSHRRFQAVEVGGVDLWLATLKCALHARRAFPRLPLAVVDHVVTLDPILRRRLHAVAERARRRERGERGEREEERPRLDQRRGD